ncbi:uncharacterized protein ATNIH1004_006118 [Aspergillus tanneri]|uniref:Uncharacterized protein n=1 Tax=Aspergillus tanneri TaxID=1220188 RepID=A0A5M9MK92_9EURO|nr:uncharacterized protein ATNIH1004_006118 [Aspergillus tanneri]KAA8647425.1 hypothetical protein ATNIH1004_006118 [Aspergillus tanneri]
MDRATSYDWPWRVMEGRYQEFVIENASDDKAKIAWAIVECSNLHPEGQSTRDFKKLAYELHAF